MSEPASIFSGIAGRYATAVFDLAREGGQVAAIEADVDALEAALKDSADLRNLTTSPLYSREEQAAAISAVAAKMGLSQILGNTLSLMAANRRLAAIPQLLAALRAKIAEEKGEVTAEVASAVALTQEQAAKLAQALSERFGKTVKLNAIVDETLIGGLVVKVGSKMIDTSIKSKLAALQNTMKEVG